MLQSTTKYQPGMQAFEIESKLVGETFTVRVQLPESYQFTENKYPVLYVLDGDASFGLAASVMSYINLGANFGLGKNIPEMIVVSIGYERGGIPWLLTRVRDFTPTEDSSFNYNNPNFVVPASGKAEAFYKFILEELNPGLNDLFRIDAEMSVLATHSMGGVFAAYTLFGQTQAFKKVIMACPFVGWDERAVFKMQEEYAKTHKELKADIFLCVTSAEPTPPYIEEVNDFYKSLQAAGYEGLNCTLVNYPEDNHFSVWAKAFIDGLAYVFNV